MATSHKEAACAEAIKKKLHVAMDHEVYPLA